VERISVTDGIRDHRVLLQVPRGQIAYLCAVVESYEGLATVGTIDGRAALVALDTCEAMMPDLMALLRDLAAEIPVRSYGPTPTEQVPVTNDGHRWGDVAVPP
jgi:hypothetical protein